METLPEEEGEVAIESAVNIILQRDVSAAREPLMFYGDRYLCLQAIDEIRRYMESTTTSDEQSKFNRVIRLAMPRLEDDFVNILIGYATPRYSNYSSSLSESTEFEFYEEDYLGYAAPSEEEINDLRCIAEGMNSAGYLHRCVQAYTRVRKALLEMRFQRLGVEKLSIQDVRRLELRELEAKMRPWMRAAKACVGGLFKIEKQLCEQIFGGVEDAGDLCFLEIVGNLAIQLFEFAAATSSSCDGSPRMERLFCALEAYETMSDLLADIEFLFQSNSGEPVRIQAVEIVSRLAEVARGIPFAVENTVLQEISTIPAPGGAIHMLTINAMKSMIRLSEFERCLVELIVSKPSQLTALSQTDDSVTPDMELMECDGKNPFELHLIWILVILLFKLEVESKLYKDAVLARVFVMSNFHYIFERINNCGELKRIIGRDCLKKLRGKIVEAATEYERGTLGMILYCLRGEGFSSGGNVARGVLRRRLKSFNALFKEVHQTQSKWLIPDLQLREDLRISISQKLILAYRTFLGRYGAVVVSGRNPEAYIKYSAEDLEAALLDLFEGMRGRSKLSSTWSAHFTSGRETRPQKAET